MIYYYWTFTLIILLGFLPTQKNNVEDHIRQACKIVWEIKPQNVDSCVNRAMAALGTNDQLIDSERALEK